MLLVLAWPFTTTPLFLCGEAFLNDKPGARALPPACRGKFKTNNYWCSIYWTYELDGLVLEQGHTLVHLPRTTQINCDNRNLLLHRFTIFCGSKRVAIAIPLKNITKNHKKLWQCKHVIFLASVHLPIVIQINRGNSNILLYISIWDSRCYKHIAIATLFNIMITTKTVAKETCYCIHLEFSL